MFTNIKTFLVIIPSIIIVALFAAGCGKKDGGTETGADLTAVQTEEFAQALHKEADTLIVIFDSIGRGEGPFHIMERLKIAPLLRGRIIYAMANEADFTALRVGEKFAAIYNLDTTKILQFVYFQDRVTTHRVKLSYDEDSVRVTHFLQEKPYTTRRRLIRGTLRATTLDEEFKNMELPPQIAQIASNVLECKIAFRTDARIGDNFELLIQETIVRDIINGETIETVLPGRSDVLYVTYSGERAKEVKAYKFFDGDKSSYNAHYTEDGEALIFSGMRYPLDRIHITSGYGMRIHPVTGQRQMHSGVDYRAKTGTPVYSVAEGKVTKSTFDANSGNFIAIKHNDNFTSYYMHLSSRGVGVGAFVKARQVIGRSGNTGRSNGPHLHFGFKQPNGAWMNPLSKRMIAVPKLEGEKLEALLEQIEEIKRVYRELDMG